MGAGEMLGVRVCAELTGPRYELSLGYYAVGVRAAAQG